ncbi:hypothetical protein STRIP9103_03701, partial [Streptomyces ipomoeae 91-03]
PPTHRHGPDPSTTPQADSGAAATKGARGCDICGSAARARPATHKPAPAAPQNPPSPQPAPLPHSAYPQPPPPPPHAIVIGGRPARAPGGVI